jgi:hypothetical protein
MFRAISRRKPGSTIRYSPSVSAMTGASPLLSGREARPPTAPPPGPGMLAHVSLFGP